MLESPAFAAQVLRVVSPKECPRQYRLHPIGLEWLEQGSAIRVHHRASSPATFEANRQSWSAWMPRALGLPFRKFEVNESMNKTEKQHSQAKHDEFIPTVSCLTSVGP
jgi:hypothetical protein